MNDPPGPAQAGPQGRPVPPRRGYLVPGLIALVVVAALAVGLEIVGLQHHTPHDLAGPDVATLIAQAMQAQDHSAQPPQISCPASEPVRAGLEFDCKEASGRSVVPIAVHETSGRGQFTWRVLSAGPPPTG